MSDAGPLLERHRQAYLRYAARSAAGKACLDEGNVAGMETELAEAGRLLAALAADGPALAAARAAVAATGAEASATAQLDAALAAARGRAAELTAALQAAQRLVVAELARAVDPSGPYGAARTAAPLVLDRSG